MAKKKNEIIKEIETKDNNILLEDKFDKENLQNELKNYIDTRINTVFVEELEKTNKKMIREKQRRIFWKNVFIIILLLIIGFLVYLLYSNNYFDRFFNKNSEIVEKNDKKEELTDKSSDNSKDEVVKPTSSPTPSPTPKIPTLDELKKEYASLLDNYYVTDNSSYLSDFYSGNLTNDMMKYMTLNTFDFSTFEKEEDYNIIKDSSFKLMFEKLFDDEYLAGTFNYDENKVRYVKAIESYMTSEVLVRDDSNIRREIKDIKLDDGKVVITTIEGIVKDNKLYNVISNEEVADLTDDSIIKYEDKLNKMVYTFKNNKLINLSK